MADHPLQRLVGTWEWQASAQGRFMEGGRATFDSIEDGAFVRLRTEAEPSEESPAEWVANSPMPVTAILGLDDSTHEQAMLYADARGVFRIYRMTLTEGAWRLERTAPGFHQRFIGDFRDDGRTIGGRWESSPDGETWEPDFDMTYRKLSR